MIEVTVVNRSGRAECAIDIDPDSFLVTGQLDEPDFAAPVRTTAELYGDLLGVPRRSCILTVGDVLLTVAEPGRLAGLEWRPGSAVLQRGRLPDLVGDPVTLHLHADWNDDGLADYPAITTGTFDPVSRSLRIDLGLGKGAARWVCPADQLIVGLTGGGSLAALQLAGLPADLCTLVGCPP